MQLSFMIHKKCLLEMNKYYIYCIKINFNRGLQRDYIVKQTYNYQCFYAVFRKNVTP